MRRKHPSDDNDNDGSGVEEKDREVCGDQGLPADCHSSEGATLNGGKQRRQDGAATAGSAVASAAQPPECNSSVEGGGQSTNDDKLTGGTEAAGGGDTTSSSANTRQGRSGNKLDACGGQEVGLDSCRRKRDGWRIGEGISVPVGGADAVWHRLKEQLEGEEAAGGGRGGYDAGDGDAERRRERMGQNLVREVVLEERREAVLQAVRWAWKVSAISCNSMLASLSRPTAVS